MSRRRPALLLLLLAGCASGPAHDPGPLTALAVAVTLPAERDASELELRLVRASAAGAAGELLVQQRLPLGPGGPPAHVVLAVPTASLDTGADYAVHGLLRDAAGRLLRESAPAPVRFAGAAASAGPLRAAGDALAPLQGFRCGDIGVVVAMEGNALLLALDGAGYRLRPLEAASGARFRREGDPAVEFWNRGETAQLTLGERRLPECRRDGT